MRWSMIVLYSVLYDYERLRTPGERRFSISVKKNRPRVPWNGGAGVRRERGAGEGSHRHSAASRLRGGKGRDQTAAGDPGRGCSSRSRGMAIYCLSRAWAPLLCSARGAYRRTSQRYTGTGATGGALSPRPARDLESARVGARWTRPRTTRRAR